MNTHVINERCFCGPPNHGNGVYTCGLLAKFIERTAEVTLRRPPPLDKPLKVKHIVKDKVRLCDQDVVTAQAVTAELDLDPPEPPTFEVANSSARKVEDISDHYFSTCFVCGPQRDEGDGLRIFPGLVEGQNYIAAPGSFFQ